MRKNFCTLKFDHIKGTRTTLRIDIEGTILRLVIIIVGIENNIILHPMVCGCFENMCKITPKFTYVSSFGENVD